jgi:hypothetical protein
VRRPLRGGSVPATEWICVVTIASSSDIRGRIDGSRLASIVFPGAGRSDHHDVVAARGRDFQRPFGLRLPRTSAKSAASMACSTTGAETIGSIGPMPRRCASKRIAPARVDPVQNVVTIDLGNALPFNADGTPADAGTLQAAIVTSQGAIPLGEVANTLENYLQRAFLFQFPLGANSAAAASNPIAILSKEDVVSGPRRVLPNRLSPRPRPVPFYAG